MFTETLPAPPPVIMGGMRPFEMEMGPGGRVADRKLEKQVDELKKQLDKLQKAVEDLSKKH